MSLVARHLEANGISTVIIGSAIDIVEYCGVPRFLFVDYPLGNPCGRPYDLDDQRTIVEQGVRLLEEARSPNQTVHSHRVWDEDGLWRKRYMQIRDGDLHDLKAKGEARKRERAERRANGQIRPN